MEKYCNRSRGFSERTDNDPDLNSNTNAFILIKSSSIFSRNIFFFLVICQNSTKACNKIVFVYVSNTGLGNIDSDEEEMSYVCGK